MTAEKNTRITADLKDIKLIHLIKIEASEKGCTQAEVLIHSLEAYFADKLETKILAKASEMAFDEWENSKDSDYDKL